MMYSSAYGSPSDVEDRDTGSEEGQAQDSTESIGSPATPISFTPTRKSLASAVDPNGGEAASPVSVASLQSQATLQSPSVSSKYMHRSETLGGYKFTKACDISLPDNRLIFNSITTLNEIRMSSATTVFSDGSQTPYVMLTDTLIITDKPYQDKPDINVLIGIPTPLYDKIVRCYQGEPVYDSSNVASYPNSPFMLPLKTKIEHGYAWFKGTYDKQCIFTERVVMQEGKVVRIRAAGDPNKPFSVANIKTDLLPMTANRTFTGYRAESKSVKAILIMELKAITSAKSRGQGYAYLKGTINSLTRTGISNIFVSNANPPRDVVTVDLGQNEMSYEDVMNEIDSQFA